MTSRVDTVLVDGGEFDAPVWLPAGGGGAGVVLIQEIFGLDDYLRSVAANLAALGYVVIVPELFWRIRRHWSCGHDEAGLAAAMALSARFDAELGRSDVLATLAHLRSLPEVRGGAGLFGFCLGGSLAFTAAAQGDPDAAVSFYGSAVPGGIALLDRITCPIQFQFGALDPYIPIGDVRRVADAVESHPGAEIYLHERAGHAFHNHLAPMFHQPEAAAAAWGLATEFLVRTLPPR
jgi:carboxymethylenebutenolidase